MSKVKKSILSVLATTTSLVPRPISSFSKWHTEKQEGLVHEITPVMPVRSCKKLVILRSFPLQAMDFERKVLFINHTVIGYAL